MYTHYLSPVLSSSLSHTPSHTREGVAVVDGKLVEGLHVEEARRMLALQRNIEASQARVSSY